MTHTPGPWRADHEGGFIVLNGSHAYSIRDICSDDRGWNAEDLDLLAAAPEVLAALKEAYDALDYAQAQVDSDTDRWHLTRCRRKIKPVIDRAEGRSE